MEVGTLETGLTVTCSERFVQAMRRLEVILLEGLARVLLKE